MFGIKRSSQGSHYHKKSRAERSAHGGTPLQFRQVRALPRIGCMAATARVGVLAAVNAHYLLFNASLTP